MSTGSNSFIRSEHSLFLYDGVRALSLHDDVADLVKISICFKDFDSTSTFIDKSEAIQIIRFLIDIHRLEFYNNADGTLSMSPKMP